MAEYHEFTSSRTAPPDLVGLIATLHASVAADVGVGMRDSQHYRLKKAAPWTAPEIAAAQSAIDTAPAMTPQLDAQHTLDDLPLWAKALALVIMDEINILRGQHALAPRTAAQLITAMKNKAATL